MSKRFTLTSDFENVKNLFIYKFFTAVDIAKQYNVSSSSVSELLNNRGITQDYRITLLLNEIVELNIILETNDLELILSHLINYPTIDIKKLKLVLRKKKYKLYDEYYFKKTKIKELLLKNKTGLEVENLLNVNYSMVYRTAKEFDIELQLIKRCKQLVDTNELINFCNNNSVKEASKKYNFSRCVIRTVLKDSGITFGMNKEVKDKLNDFEWCNRTYKKYKSYDKISKLLMHVGPDAVKHYIHDLHKIPKYKVEDELIDLTSKDYMVKTYKGKSIVLLADEMGCTPFHVKKWLQYHDIEINHDHHTSVGEKQLAQYIEETYNTCVITNIRTIITPKELDIYLPEYNLAVEYNGVYWHNPNRYESKEDWFLYHQNKIDLCKEKNIELLHLWEGYGDHNALLDNAISSIIDNNLEEIYENLFKKEVL